MSQSPKFSQICPFCLQGSEQFRAVGLMKVLNIKTWNAHVYITLFTSSLCFFPNSWFGTMFTSPEFSQVLWHTCLLRQCTCRSLQCSGDVELPALWSYQLCPVVLSTLPCGPIDSAVCTVVHMWTSLLSFHFSNWRVPLVITRLSPSFSLTVFRSAGTPLRLIRMFPQAPYWRWYRSWNSIGDV